MLRARFLRQLRRCVPALEGALADDDAPGQLQDAARTLPAPAVGYAEPSEQPEGKRS